MFYKFCHGSCVTSHSKTKGMIIILSCGFSFVSPYRNLVSQQFHQLILLFGFTVLVSTVISEWDCHVHSSSTLHGRGVTQ